MKRFLLLIIVSLLAGTCLVEASDRCASFKLEVRRAANRYLGIDYPWWYNMGVAKAESGCREGLVSFDGGIGPYQFTPSTGVGKIIEQEFPEIDFNNSGSSIKAQAYYMSIIINRYFYRDEFKFKGVHVINPKKYTQRCGLRLADIYQYYNGGYWLIYEASKANTCDRIEMRANCTRGGAWVGKRYLNFCDVNYQYPQKVFDYADTYRTSSDQKRYW